MGQSAGPRWSLSLAFSVIVHLGVLIALCWQVAPIFIRPRLLARGSGGKATPLSLALYFPKSVSLTPPVPSLLSPASSARKRQEKAKKRDNVLETSKQTDSGEA